MNTIASRFKLVSALALAAALAACGGAENASLDDTATAAAAAPGAERMKAQGADDVDGWTICGWEGYTCNFTGSRQVRYGTKGQFFTRTATGSIACSYTVFGDPAYGQRKVCWVSNAAADANTDVVVAPAPVPAAPAPVPAANSWTLCGGWEGSTCTFNGTRQVRYGTETQNVTRTFTGKALCSYTVFGDPAYGKAKQCWVAAAASAAISNPVPASGNPPPSSGNPPPVVVVEAPVVTPPVVTPPPVVTAPVQNFARTQIFRLANPNVVVTQGQNAALRLRFFGVPMGWIAKPAVNLVNGAGQIVQPYPVNHYWQLPGNAWNGYTEFDYRTNISAPVGTYRIVVSLYQGVAPYFFDAGRYECAGVERMLNSCLVGTLTVLPGNGSVADDLTRPQSAFVMRGYGWTPGS